jgi:sirohydrochlorin cobaltochelatase
VLRERLTGAALVLLGHGSTTNAESSAPVYQHAAELRRRKIFATVYEAFWKQEPQAKQVLSGISSPRVFIVPLFISEGYFSNQVIPQELGFFRGNSRLKTKNSELFYCHPVGTHDSMTKVLLARARDIVEKFPFPRPPKARDVTLFIAGHGTGQDENSRAAIERQADLIRAKNEYAGVHAVFLEEEPRISECHQLAQTKNINDDPIFISDGMHTQEDIPVLLGETQPTVRQRLAAALPAWRNPTERKGKLIWYAPAVGTAPEVADVIVERVLEAVQ